MGVLKYFFIIFYVCLSFSVDAWDPYIDECGGSIECIPIQHKNTSELNDIVDVKVLRSVINIPSSLEAALINIFMHRNLQQRLKLVRAYTDEYKQDLVEVLESRLNGKFKHLITGMLMPLADFYAREIQNTLSGIKIMYGSVIEILGTLRKKGMDAVYNRFKWLYGNSLTKTLQLARFDSINFRECCVSLSLNKRTNFNGTVDESEVESDANALLKAEEEGAGGALRFIFVLVNRSYPHLLKLFEILPDNIEYMIEGFSGRFRQALLTLISTTRNRHRFFAERLHKDLNSTWSGDYSTLIRIVVGRSDIDLGSIINQYDKIHSTKFLRAVEKSRGISKSFKAALIRFLQDGPMHSPPIQVPLQLEFSKSPLSEKSATYDKTSPISEAEIMGDKQVETIEQHFEPEPSEAPELGANGEPFEEPAAEQIIDTLEEEKNIPLKDEPAASPKVEPKVSKDHSGSIKGGFSKNSKLSKTESRHSKAMLHDDQSLINGPKSSKDDLRSSKTSKLSKTESRLSKATLHDDQSIINGPKSSKEDVTSSKSKPNLPPENTLILEKSKKHETLDGSSIKGSIPHRKKKGNETVTITIQHQRHSGSKGKKTTTSMKHTIEKPK